MLNRRRCERGVLSVEAAAVLTIYILAMSAWLFLLNVVRISFLSQQALDSMTDNLAHHITLIYGLDAQSAAERLRPILQNTLLAQRFSRFYSPAISGSDSCDRSFTLDIRSADHLLSVSAQTRIELPGLLRSMGPITLDQQAVTGLWHRDDAIDPAERKGAEQAREMFDSIWNRGNFERGRCFMEKYRRSDASNGVTALKPGRHFDLYRLDGTLMKLESLDIFSRSYTEGEGDSAAGYHLRQDALKQHLERQVRAMRHQFEAGTSWQCEGGREIEKRPDMPLELVLILPEEAIRFDAQIEALLPDEPGIRVIRRYDQKKFNVRGERHDKP